MKITLKLLLVIATISYLQSCKSVDLRSEALKANTIINAERKGRKLLEESKLAMGYDQLTKTEVYEVESRFDWNNFWLLMPMNAFPGNNGKKLELRFATNSFDGQVEYMEGRKKNTIQGVQSWQGYQRHIHNENIKKHEHNRYIWGLATYHYLIEAPMHFPNAEIIRYAGLKKVNNISYETVYVTWGSEAPNKKYDRFLVYINPNTKFIDVLEVTINDFFLPMPKGLQHATAIYKREKTEIGTYLPSKITLQLKAPKKPEKKVYSIKLENYEFDSFSKKIIYPIEDLQSTGMNKLSKNTK